MARPITARQIKTKSEAAVAGTAGSHHASPRLPKMRLHKALQKPATLSSLTQRRISKPDATGSSSQGLLLPCAGARAHAITPCWAGSFGAQASPHLTTALSQQGRLGSTEQLCSFDADRCFCSLKVTAVEIWRLALLVALRRTCTAGGCLLATTTVLTDCSWG